MEKKLILDILDEKRKNLLPLFKEFKDEFYLAGGTGLALQIGHRESEDFDFFCIGRFNPEVLKKKINLLFKKHSIDTIQLETNTISILIDNEIKISFFKIEHKVQLPLVESKWLQLSSIEEIAAMKIIALLRAAFRDYVDLYFILNKYRLENIIALCEKKYTGFEKSLYLKALLSYEDVEIAPIKYTKGNEKKIEEIFSYIEKQTRLYLENNI